MKNSCQSSHLNMNVEKLNFCGTIFGKSREDILAQARDFLEQGVDMLEVRGDAILVWGRRMPGFLKRFTELAIALDELHQMAEDVPVIFTLRTKKEGGNFRGNKKAYRYVVELFGFSQKMDIVDVEMTDATLEDVIFREASQVLHGDNLIEYFRMYDKPVLLSRHIMEEIPFSERMRLAQEALTLQEQSDADICKLAVFVEDEEQLQQFRELLNQHEKWRTRPHIGIAMGSAGIISRYSREWCGSCISYVSGKKVVAPGQLSMEEIKKQCYNI